MNCANIERKNGFAIRPVSFPRFLTDKIIPEMIKFRGFYIMGEMLLSCLSPVQFVVASSSDAMAIFFVTFPLPGFALPAFGVVIDDSRPTFGCL